MAADLDTIHENVIKVCTNVENIKSDISEMKVEREKHKQAFWDNMNTLKDNLQTEREERIKEGNKINTEVKVMKGKWSVYVGFIATGITLLIHWIKKQW